MSVPTTSAGNAPPALSYVSPSGRGMFRMSDVLRTSLTLLLPVLAVSAADLTTPFTDLRINVGLATPLQRIEAKNVDPGTGDPSYDQEIDGVYQGGPHLGLQMLRGSIDQEGIGWFWGVELAWDLHRGQARNIDGHPGDFGNDGAMELNALTATVMVGPVFQANLRDMGLRADAFRVELGPTLGAGVAQASLGSNTSDSGLLWSLGLVMQLTTTLENNLTITVGLGYAYDRAEVRWNNTGDSTASAYGVKAGLGCGWRF